MRRTIITGYFGSGKTEIAMQMARDRSENGQKVVLVDLDVANPYYTSSAPALRLRKTGYILWCQRTPNTNVDVPALTAGVRAALLDPSCDIVVDLGGGYCGCDGDGLFGELAGSGEGCCTVACCKCIPSVYTNAGGHPKTDGTD